MVRVVGNDAHGFAFYPYKAGNHANTKVFANLQHRIFVSYGIDDLAHVVQTQSILRHDMPQLALIRCLPILSAALEIAEVLFRYTHRFGFVLDQNIHNPVGHLKGHGTNFLRRVNAQTATLDHGRPTHGDGGILGRDDHIAAGEQRGVARETATVIHPNQGHGARKLGKGRESGCIEGNRRAGAVIAGTTTAALAE